jgi:hypothetical protein
MNQDPQPRAIDHEPQHRRLIGTLVHRLLQRGEDPTVGADVLGSRIVQLLTPDERVDLIDSADLVAAVVRAYHSLRVRPDIQALLHRGTPYFEVPFSIEAPGRSGDIVRGTVDCLIVAADGSATVLEFKTGDVRGEHQAQAALYGSAMTALLGGVSVNVKVLYS